MQSLMPPIDSSDNLFHNGNPLTGEKGTIVTADFLNDSQSAIRDLQAELIAILTAANMIPDAATAGQVRTAIKRMLLASNNNYFVDTGVANAIVIAPNPAFTALTDGQTFDIACAAVNTGAVTLKVNAMAAYPLLGAAGALQGGEIGVAKGVIRVVWSASQSSFLITAQNASGSLPVAPATKTGHAVNLGQFTKVFGDSGYQKLPGGLIIQWGVSSLSDSNGIASATFPIAFPAAVMSIQMSEQSTNVAAVCKWGSYTLTTTAAQFFCQTAGATTAKSGELTRYLVIGY